MAAVIIGVDPHKGSHTAVAIGADEVAVGQVRVRACAAQAERLLTWAKSWPERTWAVEGAGGLGHLLAQELLAAGEQVLDVQPKLAARVRLLATGAVNKNDPNDARSVAIAALRSPSCLPVRPDDHAAVLKIWAKRHRDLSRARTQVACRLHAALCELVPGGVGKEIRAAHAAASWRRPSRAARCGRPRRAGRRAHRRPAPHRCPAARDQEKLAAAIRACGSTVNRVFGVGPVIAATVIGDVRDVSRFAGRDCFAAYNGTAPIEVSSGNRKIYRLSRRGNRRLNHAIHMAAITQIRYRHSDGRAYYDKKLAEGKTPKEALRALKRQISDAIYKHLKADAARAAAAAAPRIREGKRGTTLSPARPAHTPDAGSSAKPLPDQLPPYDHSLPLRRPRPHHARPRVPRAAAGQALACPLFLPPGAVEAPGSRPASGRRHRRCAAALRPEGRPRNMRGTPRRTQRRRSRLHLPS